MAPVKISDRPNTFAGFDVVVSISEEAVNSQLSRLYNTTLATEGRLIPSSKLKNFKPLPASQHLINHQLSLHLINKKASTPENIVYRKTGIDGFIDCPKVRFRPEEYDAATGNAVEKYKRAYLEIKFKRDVITGADSTMTYYDEDAGENAKLVLNDCTMVWGVKIGSKDVVNVMEGRPRIQNFRRLGLIMFSFECIQISSTLHKAPSILPLPRQRLPKSSSNTLTRRFSLFQLFFVCSRRNL